MMKNTALFLFTLLFTFFTNTYAQEVPVSDDNLNTKFYFESHSIRFSLETYERNFDNLKDLSEVYDRDAQALGHTDETKIEYKEIELENLKEILVGLDTVEQKRNALENVLLGPKYKEKPWKFDHLYHLAKTEVRIGRLRQSAEMMLKELQESIEKLKT